MLTKIFGFLTDSNEKVLKKLQPLVEEINAMEGKFEQLSDDALKAKTAEFKARIREGESLNQILTEAFATVREASRRTIGQRHFDEQLLGGIVLHEGKISEMKTGEGKTLVATLPVYLNSLLGKGVHVVTVNDYLAHRDPQWMGPIYEFLGLSVGCLQNQDSFIYDHDLPTETSDIANMRRIPRKEAYQADITYGTNNEFGFDYLRDNMVVEVEEKVQRDLYYAIVDEVDNILIDEARTPLIISGPAQESTTLYSDFAKLAPRLVKDTDYEIDEKRRSTSLTDSGIEKLETWLSIDNLYNPGNYIYTHYIENALRAMTLYNKDKEYVVQEGQVVIVDDFTGRLMPGRRYSDGLHQAIEAKEGVFVQRESVTYATITLQNYFRMYDVLSGMTGTASTEAEELSKIYKLEVVAIPTHRPLIRDDMQDLIYSTESAKFKAIADELEKMSIEGRPVLVGTVSIEKSELLSDLLKKRGLSCQVLNAKQHDMEASIVAEAGKLGAITVATNMAGRGTDIILGGNPGALGLQGSEWQESHDKVISLGGLHIIGTERHESRRIDNQLRGRAGRQGDPGSSRFYVSLEDEIMRRFGGDRIKGIMEWAGMTEDTPLENRIVSKSIEASQTKVEGFHFDLRKNLVEYDDVANIHRDVIYSERGKVLDGANLKENIQDMVNKELSGLVDEYCTPGDSQDWDTESFKRELNNVFSVYPPTLSQNISAMHPEEIEDALFEYASNLYDERENAFGDDQSRFLERLVMLRTIDSHWVQHITAMENLRQGIGLHAFGQRDPLVMFKRESHELFQGLLGRIQNDITHTIFKVAATTNTVRSNVKSRQSPQSIMSNVVSNDRSPNAKARPSGKVGRNEPCPCGSGKKYKRCHGLAA